ncbi:hypothetical protein XACJK48_2970015 [Xanthomonas citri pv. citri]|nr:hypothetical protein XAC3824_270051 [Xanthomonas citri pv. citri]CEE34666.1 hypothetical protein XAC902_330042 [Xanthomonas citri pv. citri]CEE35065.1 hypothetical protein XAC2911_250126 [Xanthomonas citri pv. citri]CEE56845.1 hypothetical protein XAC71A_310052 [Xanthomonas citri pv. citri]CEE63439.1 hypothetical protein XACS584_320165 [Xanthomonas citri pv. citri]
MAQISLNDLIEALAGAVIDAQDRIEQHQMANLGAFFDEDNRPRSVLIRLPSQHRRRVRTTKTCIGHRCCRWCRPTSCGSRM